VLTHGREGFLAEPKNPASLAAGIVRLLSDRQLRRMMAEAGARTARQYDWPIVAERILGYYERVQAAYPVAKPRGRWYSRTAVGEQV
jgi:glycosyltransferase involved in cell wall biosynthesis